MSAGFSQWLTIVYGPTKRRERNIFMSAISNLKNTCFPNQLIGGDFNVVRWESKTSVHNLAKHNMKKFNSIINQIGLIEPPITNDRFTWSNLRTQTILSRLDHFLCTTQWEDRFSTHFSRTLERVTSDHFHLVLEDSHLNQVPTPFHFNNINLELHSINKNVKGWQDSTSQVGFLGYSFNRRLKQLANRIKSWQSRQKKVTEEEKNSWIQEIKKIDKLESQQSLSDIDSAHRTSLKIDPCNEATREAQYWAQRYKRL